MITKKAINLRPGDMIWFEGEPAEVEAIKTKDFVRTRCGQADVPALEHSDRYTLRPGEVQVFFRQYTDWGWAASYMHTKGAVELCPHKFIVLPCGKRYTIRNEDGDETSVVFGRTVVALGDVE